MNIENLLKYQKLDEELFKVEQKLSNSPYKKKANELMGVAKKTQVKSAELETEANKLVNEINDLKDKVSLNNAKLDELLSKDIEHLSMEEIEKLNVLRGKILSNLNFFEKTIQKSAESVHRILVDYNNTFKTYNEAKSQYAICKQKIDEESKASEPDIKRLETELKKLEKSVEEPLLSEYKKKRQDKIFPVVVPLERGTFCGYCRMEQPKVALSRLKEKGVITCEHCKRYIYQ